MPLEQTIVDCARTVPFVPDVIIGDSGLHKGAKMDTILKLLDGNKGGRGVAAARKVIGTLDDRSESAGKPGPGSWWREWTFPRLNTR